MNDRIRLYIDEVKGYENSFFIHTCIYASPSSCDTFESDMIKLIDSNRNTLGKDFKGFHANKLNQSNWRKIAPIYESVIRLIVFNSLSVHIYLESKHKHDKNSQVLKNYLKSQLDDKTSTLRKALGNIKSKDFPVIYNRFEMLYIFLIHKNKFGQNCEFEIYPDSTGKVLDYVNKKIELVSSNKMTKRTVDFYTLFEILANLFIDILDEIKYLPNKNQNVIRYTPTDDSDCSLIQACDIISNYLFNYFKYHSGINDLNSKLKADVFANYFPILNGEDFVKTNFTIVDDNVVCINKNMKKNITNNPSS